MHLEDTSLHNGPTLTFPFRLLWVIGVSISTVTSVPRIHGRVDKHQKGEVEAASPRKSTSEPTEDKC